jgi:hypothetical protein
MASWSDDLSSESEAFFNSINYLFKVAADNKVKKVFIDCGVPAGGTLTEGVINFVEASITGLELEKIAVLESIDYHWDNNLMQLLQYLKQALNLSFQAKLFTLKKQALEWLIFG